MKTNNTQKGKSLILRNKELEEKIKFISKIIDDLYGMMPREEYIDCGIESPRQIRNMIKIIQFLREYTKTP